jgi:hypothetical protein
MSRETHGPEYKAYLAALKPGDEIIYLKHSRWGGYPEAVKLTVTRRTATQIIFGEGRNPLRFKAGNGLSIGRSNFSFLPWPATPEELAAAIAAQELAEFRVEVRKDDLTRLPIEALREIKAVIDKYRAPKEGSADAS